MDVDEKTKRVIQTPLPKMAVFILFLNRLIDELSVSSLFPYISLLTVDVLQLDEEKDAKLVGYYSGFIAASYFVSQMIFSPIWGAISDRIGRRPVMLISTLGTGISCMLFGFSKFYWWALISRSLFGALNGNLGVAKTYLREVCDETNQSKAFSIVLNAAFSASMIIGPLIGGFLSRPFNKIPILFDNFFFRTFPYVLPNMVLCFLSILGFTFSFFFLKETRFQTEEKSDIEEISNVIVEETIDTSESEYVPMSIDNVEMELLNTSEEINKENINIKDNLLTSDEVKSQDEIKESLIIQKEVTIRQPINEEKLEHKQKSILNRWKAIPNFFLKSNLLKMAPIVSTVMYSLMGMHQIVFDEVLPIWIWTPTTNNGLGLVPYKIGIIQGIIGGCLFFNQFTLIPWFINKFAPRNANRIAVLIIIPFSIGIVEIYRIAKLENIEWLIWILLIVLLQLRLIFCSIAFTSVILLVNNSVPKESLGSLNGISQSAVAFTRAVGPSLATPLFALSLSSQAFYPFDVHLSFYFSAMIIALLLPLSFLLPPRMKEQ
eukprot:gene6434-10442_t